MVFRFLAAALAAAVLSPTTVYAQPDPPPVDDADPPRVVARVSSLEQYTQQLDARVKALEGKKADTPATADRWTVPQFPGTVFTKAQLVAMYPGITFNQSAAPGVASTAPFAACPCPDNCTDGTCDLTGCVAGCGTTRTIGATGAATKGTTLTYGLAPSGGLVTSIGVGCAATSGGTSSACANGACGVQTRQGWYLGKNLGRQAR